MKKKKIVIGAVALIAVVIAVLSYHKINKGNEVLAEIYEVGAGEVSEYVEETGTVKSKNQRMIYSISTGEIGKLNVTEGDSVKQDDILAEIDTEKAELEIKSLEAKIQALRATYKEALKPADKSEIAKAKANVETSRVKVEEAKRNLENSKELYNNGAISLDAYKTAQENLAIQENSLKIAESELILVEKGVSSNIKNQYEAEIADLIYQKEVLEKNKEELIIKAPNDGIITEVFIKEGTYLQPGTEILEIGDTHNLYIEVDVLASEVGDIKKDGLAIIYSEDLGIDELKGSVEKIYPKAFSKVSDLGIEQKRVRIDINVPQNEKLKMGYEVDSKFRLWTKSNVLIVPGNSVFELENSKFVFIVENDKAVLKKIETGLEGEDFIEVKSGLKEGDKVIVSPNEDVKEGSIIKTGKSNIGE